MPQFSNRSNEKLKTCHWSLQSVFLEVVKHFDCTILTGYRTEEDQNQAVTDGRSQVRFPNGKHNSHPSRAVDVAPYPIDWNDRERFHLFAGYVLGTARNMGINLRWGGDWDKDTEVKDNRFDDLVHFEIG